MAKSFIFHGFGVSWGEQWGICICTLHPGKLTCPLKRHYFNIGNTSSNHQFSGDMLVFGSVSLHCGDPGLFCRRGAHPLSVFFFCLECLCGLHHEVGEAYLVGLRMWLTWVSPTSKKLNLTSTNLRFEDTLRFFHQRNGLVIWIDFHRYFWSLKVCTGIALPRDLDGFLFTHWPGGRVARVAKMPELEGI